MHLPRQEKIEISQIEPKEADPTAAATPHIKLPRSDTLEEMRPPPPFPQRLKNQKHEYQFKKFFGILK
ncbi:hypothetical protein GQ457_02G025200 [Hibiscus cannabinus]